jgi:hypothetical protein
MQRKTPHKNFGFDLVALAKTFGIHTIADSPFIADWVAASYSFDAYETRIMADTHAAIAHYNEQMNEEELKIRMVAPLFYAAKVDIPGKLQVFYERPLSGEVKGHRLAVITDCMVATPIFNAPDAPYFFLQAYKRKKGDKNDPEAQLLTAMLLAQAANPQSDRPLYGSYVIGTSWRFVCLHHTAYAVSPLYEATRYPDLVQIAAMLRHIRTFC